MSLIRTRQRDQRGLVSVIVAISALALIVVAALVIDGGSARLARRSSQNAADAASLAGANMLYPKTGQCVIKTNEATPPCFQDAVKAVKNYAGYNIATTETWATCTDPGKGAGAHAAVPNGSDCISFYGQAASPTVMDTVRVRLPQRTVPTGLGSMAGRSSIAVSAKAEATVVRGQNITCALCFLGSVDAGNGDFSVSGGAVAVNGDVNAGPQSIWTATTIGITGHRSGGQFNPPPITVPGFSDPWATSPTLPPSTTGSVAKTNPCTSGPGTYGSVSIGNCMLTPGLYVITGTWSLGNKSLLEGTGVTLYFQAPSGQLAGKNGNVSISAPTSGALANLAVVYDRSNTNDLGLQGNGSTSITGAVYAPASMLDFNGNSCFGFSKGPIIIDGVIKANGNQSCVTVSSAVDATVASLPGAVSLSR